MPITKRIGSRKLSKATKTSNNFGKLSTKFNKLFCSDLKTISSLKVKSLFSGRYLRSLIVKQETVRLLLVLETMLLTLWCLPLLRSIVDQQRLIPCQVRRTRKLSNSSVSLVEGMMAPPLKETTAKKGLKLSQEKWITSWGTKEGKDKR